MIGADEAGKGPVLGPMVAAAVRCDPATLPDDVDDSKNVAPGRREAIAAELRDREDVAVGVGVVEPAEIDAPETDMNSLTVTVQARAIASAIGASGTNAARAASAANAGGEGAGERDEQATEVVVDAGDVSESRFGRRVADAVIDRVTAVAGDDDAGHSGAAADDAGHSGVAGDATTELSVHAEHGADETYPIVSAASIVAKVERDARIAAIDAAHPDYDVGSGYPSDPATRNFLEAHVAATGEVPDCARRSWSTCEQVLAAAEQADLDEF